MTSAGDAIAVAATYVDDVRAVRAFGDGHINETFLVDAPSGEYVLQRLNTTVFVDPDAVMRNIQAVCAHVHGRLVPELVHSSGPWRMWRRVPDAGPISEVTRANAASAGELVGRFHSLVSTLDPAALTETLPNFHDPSRRLDRLRDAIGADAHQRASSATAEIDQLIAASPLAERSDELRRTVPTRVAHFDAKLDNVLFRGDAAVCLVDLDTVMPGAWLWDVGDLVRTTATPAREDDPDRSVIDPELYTAVVDGYLRRARAVLEPSEVDALDDAGAIVTFEQGVRFLTDWLEGDVYYRTVRPDQNLDRARAQLRLLMSMPTTVRWR